MIEIGCCTFNFRGYSLKQALRLVRDLGFRRIDVGASGPTAQVDQTAAADDPAGVGGDLRRLLMRHHLTPVELFVCVISALGRPVQVNDPDPAAREALLARFRGLCQCAAEAGFESVMGVPGVPQKALSDAEAWDVAIETLSRMVEIAGTYGVHLNVEPHAGSIVQEPETALRLVEAVPGLGYTLDYAHFVGREIPQAAVAPLQAHARHMHAKPARPGVPKCLVHENGIDWEALVGELVARGWEGVIAIEYIGNMDAVLQVENPAYQDVLLAEALRRALAIHGITPQQSLEKLA